MTGSTSARLAPRLLRLSGWKLAVLAAVVLAAVGGGAFWGYSVWNEGEGGVEAEAEAEGIRYRWVNVSIEVPRRAGPGGIAVNRHEGLPDIYSPSPGTRVPGLRIFKESSNVYVDATTGQVVHEDVRPEDRAEFDAVLASLRFEGPDPPDIWPYSDVPPEGERRRAANITYIEPDPASGIAVGGGIADGSGRSAVFVTVSNGRSRRHIDAETGQVIVASGEVLLEQLDERDQEAFERFISSIELVAESAEPSPEPTAPATPHPQSTPGALGCVECEVKGGQALRVTAEDIQLGPDGKYYVPDRGDGCAYREDMRGVWELGVEEVILRAPGCEVFWIYVPATGEVQAWTP